MLKLKQGFGRLIRNDIVGNQGGGRWDCGLRIAGDQKAAQEWEVLDGGGVYAVGLGGPLTSRSADVMVIDDPIKGRKDADSDIMRDDAWDWWESTASSRFSPGTSVLIPLTRWHHDDIVGRLLTRFPGEWDVVHIPAEADPAIVDPDPLGRAPGEFMRSARGRTLKQWEQRKRDAGDEWTPLYQGAPQVAAGSLFDVSKLRYWHPSRDGTELVCGPRSWRLRGDCWVFVPVDLAESTRKSADYTVAAAWAIPTDGSLVLLDVARDRVPPQRQIDVARPLVERWAARCVYVESNMRSTQLIREAVAEGWQVDDLLADTDKVRRAAPAAKRVDAGRVWFPAEHEHLEAFRAELKQFPLGRHDDMVDNLAYATRVLFQDYVPPADSDPPAAKAPELGDVTRATDVPAGWNADTAQW